LKNLIKLFWGNYNGNGFLPRVSRKRAGSQQHQTWGNCNCSAVAVPPSFAVAVVLPARFCEIRGKKSFCGRSIGRSSARIRVKAVAVSVAVSDPIRTIRSVGASNSTDYVSR
jgi:hypothetical protein